MLLHFIFVIKEEDLGKRDNEFEYIKQMAQFFKVWIRENFSREVEVKCDEMITKPRSFIQRLDTHLLLKDHKQRGEDIYHFYLCHFKPLWTDCLHEGYSSENFSMVQWQKPKNGDDILFLAEKNCTGVSHQLTHEFLRQAGKKKFLGDVHDVWTKHTLANLPFEQYGKDFKKTEGKPMFLTMEMSDLRL